MGLDERPGNPFQHLGVGHGRCLLAVTVFPQLPPPPTSSAWTTTLDTACCGSPATSSGGSVTCCSLCETCCWPSCSNGASHCGACTRRLIGQRQTPRKPPRPEALSASLPGRSARTICSFPR